MSAGKLSRFGLAARLNAITILILLVVTVLADVVVLKFGSDAAYQTLINRGDSMVRMAAESAEYALFTHDRVAIDNVFSALNSDRTLVYAELFDSGGGRLGRHLRQENYALQQAALPLVVDKDAVQVLHPDSALDPVDFVKPVFSGGGAFSLKDDPLSGGSSALIGFVRIGISQEYYQSLMRRSIQIVAVISAAVLFFAVLITTLFLRRAVAPLQELASMATSVAQGRLDIHLKHAGHGEVANLALAFQRMVENLRESRAHVHQYQYLLEEKVKRRTEELQEVTNQAVHLAQHDILTGLANRAVFVERLRQAIAVAEAASLHVGVMFLDLDRFKRVNDAMGHGVGDQVLKHVAERLRRGVRSSDLVARFGGDEFVILATSLDSIEEAEHLSDRILQVFVPPISIAGQDFQIGLSIGIAVYPRDGCEPSALLKHADIAMYAAKESGRGGYRHFEEEMNQRIVERIQLEDGLQVALERHEFFLEYQPQLDVVTSKIVGAEVLLRWQDPVRGLIAPGLFIPVAESSGLIVSIGRWVLEETCRRAARWIATGQGVSRVAVNISAVQFERPDFVDLVAEVLRVTDLPPQALELELTESVIVRNTALAQDAMRRIKALGVSIALDDFGTGYSSLSYLSCLPIDVIKIDRSFVLAALTDNNARAIVRSIIALAHSLDRKVIAEGVESIDQYELLCSWGCHEIQGYLLSPPCDDQALLSLCVSPPAAIQNVLSSNSSAPHLLEGTSPSSKKSAMSI